MWHWFWRGKTCLTARTFSTVSGLCVSLPLVVSNSVVALWGWLPDLGWDTWKPFGGVVGRRAWVEDRCSPNKINKPGGASCSRDRRGEKLFLHLLSHGELLSQCLKWEIHIVFPWELKHFSTLRLSVSTTRWKRPVAGEGRLYSVLISKAQSNVLQLSRATLTSQVSTLCPWSHSLLMTSFTKVYLPLLLNIVFQVTWYIMAHGLMLFAISWFGLILIIITILYVDSAFHS